MAIPKIPASAPYRYGFSAQIPQALVDKSNCRVPFTM